MHHSYWLMENRTLQVLVVSGKRGDWFSEVRVCGQLEMAVNDSWKERVKSGGWEEKHRRNIRENAT